jgi:hypothetical protein
MRLPPRSQFALQARRRPDAAPTALGTTATGRCTGPFGRVSALRASLAEIEFAQKEDIMTTLRKIIGCTTAFACIAMAFACTAETPSVVQSRIVDGVAIEALSTPGQRTEVKAGGAEVNAPMSPEEQASAHARTSLHDEDRMVPTHARDLSAGGQPDAKDVVRGSGAATRAAALTAPQ